MEDWQWENEVSGSRLFVLKRMNSAVKHGPPFHPKKPYKTYLYAGGTIAIIPRRAAILLHMSSPFSSAHHLGQKYASCTHTRDVHASWKEQLNTDARATFYNYLLTRNRSCRKTFEKRSWRGGFVFPLFSLPFVLRCFYFSSRYIYIYFFFGHSSNVIHQFYRNFFFCLFDIWKFKGSWFFKWDVSPAFCWTKILMFGVFRWLMCL